MFSWALQTRLDENWMRIGSVHMNPHKINAHLIKSTSIGGLDVHSSWIVLLFMIHAMLHQPQYRRLLVGLACGMCYIFCPCSNIGEEGSLFLMAKKSGTSSTVKNCYNT